ncbi:MAG: SDR family NAD(P)-dependent oxidoreductase [Bacilli bacterium]
MNILITGATSGIGYALTEKLIKNGHKVFLGVHTKKEVKTALEKIKEIGYQDRVNVLKLDITKKEDRNIIKDLDIDCLVNQAGIGIGGSLLNMKISDIRKNFEVNFFGTLEMTKLYIETRKNKKGKILITSSLAGLVPIPFLGSYCSTKTALITMATCLKKEIKKTNLDIKIKLIEPGAYKTGFNQIMIENKNILKEEMFNQSLESISKTMEDQFSLIEKKNLSSIVNKMYKAIESNSNRLIYRAPFIQVLGAKLYMLLFK